MVKVVMMAKVKLVVRLVVVVKVKVVMPSRLVHAMKDSLLKCHRHHYYYHQPNYQPNDIYVGRWIGR
jgi:hypothetical protein